MKRLLMVLFGKPERSASAVRVEQQTKVLEQAVREHRAAVRRVNEQMATSVQIAQDALRERH